MRELLENALYAPTRGRFKVYIIDEVHMLSRSAFNAMLKTLEEPPEHVKFILATTDPQKVPVTVLSRCLQFNLKQIPVPQIRDQLDHVLAAGSGSHSSRPPESDRARRARQHARCAEPARSGDRARRRQRGRGVGAGDAGRGGSGVSVRASWKRWPAATAPAMMAIADEMQERSLSLRGRAAGSGEPAASARAGADRARRASQRTIPIATRLQALAAQLRAGGPAALLSDRPAGARRSVRRRPTSTQASP